MMHSLCPVLACIVGPAVAASSPFRPLLGTPIADACDSPASFPSNVAAPFLLSAGVSESALEADSLFSQPAFPHTHADYLLHDFGE